MSKDPRPLLPRVSIVFLSLFAPLALASTACLDDGAPDSGVVRDASVRDAGALDAIVADAEPADTGVDAGPADAGPRDGGSYAHVPPPDVAVPASLQSATWLAHWRDDVRPYWMMPEAWGSPEGNYPTTRDMNGLPAGSPDRRPRMMGRQIYLYAMGYLLTGEPRLLELADAGADWLMRAKDAERGGWSALLTASGRQNQSQAKLAQDTSYVMLGFAAYHFVTRDAAAEAELLATRDLLFDESKYWDATNRRIRDGLDAAMEEEVDVENDGGWELVAQLDPVNAFLLLSQPVVRDPARRAQLLGDLRTLGETMIEHFFQDGMFWGVSTNKGRYGTKHVDFGHDLKTFWMLLQIDKRLDDHPFSLLVGDHVHQRLERAYDAANGMWAKRPTSATAVEYGSDWWIYSELDQIAATLNLIDQRYTTTLTETGGNWLEHYVDRTRAVREVYPGIDRTGNPGWTWPDSDTAKCNLWKNGFHSTEHALVMYLLGKYLERAPVTLHFAVPDADVDTFVARPYTFLGREVSRTRGSTISVGGAELRQVEVTFDQLY